MATKKFIMIPYEKYTRLVQSHSEQQSAQREGTLGDASSLGAFESSIKSCKEPQRAQQGAVINATNSPIPGSLNCATTIQTSDHVQSEPDTVADNSILTQLPRNIRHKCKVILSYLRNSAQYEISHNLEFVAKGVPIRGSNIVDLLKSVQYKYKTFKPIGYNAFYKYLQAANIPKSCYLAPPNTSPAKKTTKPWMRI